MIRVRMADYEIELAKQIGLKRQEENRKLTKENVSLYAENGPFADQIGMLGELAIAKHFNVCPDLDVVCRRGSWDGLLYGWRYDAKTTHYKTGRLLGPDKKNPDVEIYILCIAPVKDFEWKKNKTVSIVGWSHEFELYNEKNVGDLGRGKHFEMDQDELEKDFQRLDYLRNTIY